MDVLLLDRGSETPRTKPPVPCHNVRSKPKSTIRWRLLTASPFSTTDASRKSRLWREGDSPHTDSVFRRTSQACRCIPVFQADGSPAYGVTKCRPLRDHEPFANNSPDPFKQLLPHRGGSREDTYSTTPLPGSAVTGRDTPVCVHDCLTGGSGSSTLVAGQNDGFL